MNKNVYIWLYSQKLCLVCDCIFIFICINNVLLDMNVYVLFDMNVYTTET